MLFVFQCCWLHFSSISPWIDAVIQHTNKMNWQARRMDALFLYLSHSELGRICLPFQNVIQWFSYFFDRFSFLYSSFSTFIQVFRFGESILFGRKEFYAKIALIFIMHIARKYNSWCCLIFFLLYIQHCQLNAFLWPEVNCVIENLLIYGKMHLL